MRIVKESTKKTGKIAPLAFLPFYGDWNHAFDESFHATNSSMFFLLKNIDLILTKPIFCA